MKSKAAKIAKLDPRVVTPDQSLSTRVYNDILDRLLSSRLKPGQVFNRRQIAADLGVSVAPVLQAMLELQTEGLIEALPRKGTRVRTLTLKDLQGQLILREALECQAARHFCGEPVRRHARRLGRMARLLDHSDPRSAEHCKQEIRFHHFLVSLAGVPALTGAFERVMKLGLLYAIQMLHPDQASASRSSHVELIEVLANSDPDRAEAAARAHTRSGKEAILRIATASPSSEPPPVPASPGWLK